jgi:hypothetical protein
MPYRYPVLKCLLALIAWPLVDSAAAPTCDCFSAELRAKTARGGLANARLALLGRIVFVAPDGSARLLISESFYRIIKWCKSSDFYWQNDCNFSSSANLFTAIHCAQLVSVEIAHIG